MAELGRERKDGFWLWLFGESIELGSVEWFSLSRSCRSPESMGAKKSAIGHPADW